MESQSGPADRARCAPECGQAAGPIAAELETRRTGFHASSMRPVLVLPEDLVLHLEGHIALSGEPLSISCRGPPSGPG